MINLTRTAEALDAYLAHESEIVFIMDVELLASWMVTAAELADRVAYEFAKEAATGYQVHFAKSVRPDNPYWRAHLLKLIADWRAEQEGGR